jgi:3-hydroxymyristoyl/3-hydroxydecanoyl-(acyl carrier protein) dehydratase/carbonic anhydrase/acetyltransferase-like protein (isoleucine patch superfamily)
VHLDLPALLDRVHYRYPSLLIDAVGEHEPGARLTAFKNLTINEDFFAGHFPGAPVMPAVLTIEALTQVAAVLILVRRRATLAKAAAIAYVGGQRVAEAELVLAIERGAAYVDPTAQVHPGARIGEGTIIGANCTIGAEVTIGTRCRIDPSVVIDGWTEIGDETHIFPMASIGLAPQDLKYRGERTRLTIGRRNTIREFATINRGTAGGGGHTSIGALCRQIRHMRSRRSRRTRR